MVATRDIGLTAAGALLEPPSKTEVIELSGPAKHSFADAAAAFSRAFGKPVQAVRVPDEGVVPALVAAGLTAELGALYLEMAQGIERGLVAFEGNGRSAKGTIALEQFVAGLAKG